MRIEWLMDLLAIMETESLIHAAEKRFLSQPAFSRRIRAIEESIGVELLDRTRKPAQFKPHVIEQKQKIQQLINGMQELVHELQYKDSEMKEYLTIACPHSITTAVVPDLIKQTSEELDIDIHLKSSNHEECYAQVMTRQADIMVVYSSQNEHLSHEEKFTESCQLDEEILIPVCASSNLQQVEDELNQGKISIIAYPSEVFFGKLLEQQVFPIMRKNLLIRKNTETALSLATLQFALVGVGVAWLPKALTRNDIESGRLIDLSDQFPSVDLTVLAIRLKGSKSESENRFWEIIQS